MKALVKSRDGRGMWMEEVKEPEPGINDVKIRALYTGICGTDLHIYEWDLWARSTIAVPLVIGHEFVGEVVAVGSNVSDLQVGDLTSGEGHVVCGRCRNCLAGRRHLCAHTQGVGVNRPGPLRSTSCFQVRTCGSMARRSPRNSLRYLIRSATPFTPPFHFLCSERTCSSRARARSASWRRLWRGLRALGMWSLPT
jgi:D-arabinose 1-dehydrogenase-like Zn-dependent alcohol dehydrogenase